jgi:hypothetical protein
VSSGFGPWLKEFSCLNGLGDGPREWRPREGDLEMRLEVRLSRLDCRLGERLPTLVGFLFRDEDGEIAAEYA